jgi:hypothetical protein
MAKIQGTFGSISDDVIQKSKISKIDTLIAERDAVIAERDAVIAERDEIVNSRIWRISSIYRSLRIWISRI